VRSKLWTKIFVCLFLRTGPRHSAYRHSANDNRHDSLIRGTKHNGIQHNGYKHGDTLHTSIICTLSKMTFWITPPSVEGRYAISWVAFFITVPIVIMLNVVMVSVMAPYEQTLTFIIGMNRHKIQRTQKSYFHSYFLNLIIIFWF
jgi:hypothetical protein